MQDIYLGLVCYLQQLMAEQEQQWSKCQVDSNKPVFVLAVAGSVAAGKTTFAELIKSLLLALQPERSVAVVSTDHFLYPNHKISELVGMTHKGFPGSYRYQALVDFVKDCRQRRQPQYQLTEYSHKAYDLDGFFQVMQPDVLIVEGIIALQPNPETGQMTLRHCYDFGIYIDVPETLLWQWFFTRFEGLRTSAQDKPQDFYYQWAHLTSSEAEVLAKAYWQNINLKNLQQHILPSKLAADCCITKTEHHHIKQLSLRY